MIALTLVAAFFGLILIGAPIAVALGGSAVVTSMLFSPIADGIIGQKLFSNLNHFTLMAIPFFFLAAGLMEQGRLVQRLVGLARAMVGHLKAGRGMTTVLTCIFFAAISGSSPATVAAVGNILYPSLPKEGYSQKYAVGALATSGAIGILIPPSIPLILYGFVTETSIPARSAAHCPPCRCRCSLWLASTALPNSPCSAGKTMAGRSLPRPRRRPGLRCWRWSSGSLSIAN